MGFTNGTLRLITAGIGGLNLGLIIFIVAAPFWRVTSTSMTSSAYATIWGYEGLWMECLSLYRQSTQCHQIGQMVPYYQGSASRPSMNYYTFGVYAHLSAYRAFMIIALVSTFVAFGMSVVGLKVVTLLEEESKTKRYVNLGAGFLHFVTGLVTGVAVSWYAGEVVHEYWSPYYQTTRVKYTLGACLYIGWIAMALSLAAGCLLTCCTYFNNPVDNTKYEDRTVSRIEVVPEVAETPMLWAAPIDHREEEDYYEKKSSKHSHHTKSHKSHHSHHHSSHHHSEKQSSWDSVTDDDHHDGNGYLHEDVRMDNFV